LNFLRDNFAAELRLLRKFLPADSAAAADAELLQLTQDTAANTRLVPTSFRVHPNKTLEGLRSLAFPDGTDVMYRTVSEVPNLKFFYTPLVGAWFWVLPIGQQVTQGELVIGQVISKLLLAYSGTQFCDPSYLFLDIGANSG
jgi:hypothetical protein